MIYENTRGPVLDRVLLGCNALSTLSSRRAAFRLLEAAVASGIRNFDTARSYGKGFSERLLGEFLAGSGSGLAVTSKLGPAIDKFACVPTRLALPLNALQRRMSPANRTPGATASATIEPTRRIGRAEVERSIERSLRCLRRDWIDVFLLHEALPHQLDDGARDVVAALRADGTIRKFGIGTSRRTIEAFYTTEDPLCEVLQYDCAVECSQSLLRRFPLATHIHHSLFRRPDPFDAAVVVRDALAANPAGKVIFGTTRPDHLRHNVSLVS